MTTIAVDRNGILAWDTRSTYYGDVTLACTDSKVQRLTRGPWKGWAFGGSGDLCYWLGVRELLEDEKAKVTLPGGDSHGSAILVRDGVIRRIEQWGLPYSTVRPPFALGSGHAYALGALAMGATAVQAVRAACKYDQGSGLPVRWMRP